MTVDIAQGQTITDLRIIDHLPDNQQYLSLGRHAGHILKTNLRQGLRRHATT